MDREAWRAVSMGLQSPTQLSNLQQLFHQISGWFVSFTFLMSQLKCHLIREAPPTHIKTQHCQHFNHLKYQIITLSLFPPPHTHPNTHTPFHMLTSTRYSGFRQKKHIFPAWGFGLEETEGVNGLQVHHQGFSKCSSSSVSFVCWAFGELFMWKKCFFAKNPKKQTKTTQRKQH